MIRSERGERPQAPAGSPVPERAHAPALNESLAAAGPRGPGVDLGLITSMAQEIFAALTPGASASLPAGLPTTNVPAGAAAPSAPVGAGPTFSGAPFPAHPSLPAPPSLGTSTVPSPPSPSPLASPPSDAEVRGALGTGAAALGAPNPFLVAASLDEAALLPAFPLTLSFPLVPAPHAAAPGPDPRALGAAPSPAFATASPATASPALPSVPGSPSFPATPAAHAAPSPRAPLSLDHVSLHAFEPTLVPELREAPRTPGLFDPHAVRRDFPILQTTVHGRRLIWLDNAATTQKPQAVIDRLSTFYETENSNIHRAAHALAARATDAYEGAREKTRRFLNASSTQEIIFVRGTTEGINFVAQSWGRRHIQRGDEIVITWLEHHANIVPWQQLCAEKGARLRVAPVDDDGQILLDEYEKLLGPRTRLVSLSQVSNALGTITPAQQMVASAKRVGARVVVDGAQAVSHMTVDVQSLGCDFYVFSGHKVFGPTGIGAVYGTKEVLDETPPWQGGGNMIADVTFEKTIYQPPPARFEAGTGNIADAVGLGAALDYVDSLGRENIARYEHELLVYGTQQLKTVPGLKLIGTAPEKAGVLSFVLDGFRTEDVGAALDKEGIAVRSGHHCAQPILRRFGLESTVRPSLAPYNTCEDLDALVAALHRLTANAGRR